MRSWCDATDFNVYAGLDTHAGTPPSKIAQLIISRAATRCKAKAVDWSSVLGLYVIVTAFWRADSPVHEPIRIPPRGEEAPGGAWQMQKAMYGTRRASLLLL